MPEHVRQIRDVFRSMPWAAFMPEHRRMVMQLDEYYLDVLSRTHRGLSESELRRLPEFLATQRQVGGVPRYLTPFQASYLKAFVGGALEVWGIGPNRSGKTVGGALDAVFSALGRHPYESEMELAEPPVKVWCGFPDLKNHGKPITVPLLRWALGKAGVRFHKNDGVFSVCSHMGRTLRACTRCSSPSLMILKSYDSGVTKWQGDAPAKIWFDEAPPEDIYGECSIRIGGQHRLLIGGTLTPLKDAAWIHSEIKEPWEDEGRPPDRVFLEGFDIADNRYLAPDEVERVRDKYKHDPVQLAVRTQGKWAMVSGKVFPMLDRAVHVVEDFEVPGVHVSSEGAWTLYRAVDPGIRNPTAVLWVACAPDGLCYVYREAFFKDMSIPEVCAAIFMAETPAERQTRFRYTVVDPAAAQRDLADGQARIDTYAKHGLVCMKGNNDRQGGIDALKEAFSWEKDDLGEWRRQPKYRWFSSCVRSWREFCRYTWLPHKDTAPRGPRDDAAKKDDHSVDALRYLEATGVGPVFVSGRRETVEVPFNADTGY